MYLFLLFYFIRYSFLFILFKLLSTIKINLIIGTFSSYLTFFNGLIPIIFNSSLVGKFLILSKLSYTNFLYKLPGISNIIFYSALKNNKYINIIKTIIIVLFFSATYIFIILEKNTIYYSLPWIFCILYIIIRFKKKLLPIEIIFLSTWIAHAVGTITYGYLNGFLTYKSYLYLLPISIMERITFIFSSIILIKTINIFDVKLQKILNIDLKKQLL